MDDGQYFIQTDPAGNIKADKEKFTEKMDGALATIMDWIEQSDVEILIRRLCMIVVDC